MGRTRFPEGFALRASAYIACSLLYLAAHLLLSWCVSLHEQRMLHDAPRHAQELVSAATHLRSVAHPPGPALTQQERTALRDIDAGTRSLQHAAAPGHYRATSSLELATESLERWRSYRRTGSVPTDPWAEQENDPCHGRALPTRADPACDLAFAARYLRDVPDDVAGERRRIAADVTRKRGSFVTYGALALPFVASRLILARRRRRVRIASDVVRMARELTPVRPWWYRSLHGLLTGLGHVVLLAGIFGGTAAITAWNLDINIGIRALLLVGSLTLAVSGSVLLRHCRPRARADPIRALARTGQAPVLYLRSFVDDEEAARTGDIPLPGMLQFAGIETREELFATVLGAFGPVVAVGRPDERLPPMGAVRLYFPSDAWQSAVAQLMEQSRLVVIRLGEGEQLWWEFDHAVRHVPPEKVLAVLPGQPLPAGLTDRLDASLPTPSGAADAVRLSGNGWASAVVSFDAQWQARVCPVGPLPGEKSHLSPAHEVAKALQLALAAVGVRRRGLGLRMNTARLSRMGKAFLVLPLLALAVHTGLLISELRR
ncbi:hypothetical protein OG866_42965 [Streptomyces sp. NBC_00663]|uniref:hypothetical protein n=1 Tax=Streptomyces sp. NBC_00663 TaxID=2975801 RepID=UPI002E3636F6|nr:hypothetical protein [Streptomyces sp. NBC_00663]